MKGTFLSRGGLLLLASFLVASNIHWVGKATSFYRGGYDEATRDTAAVSIGVSRDVGATGPGEASGEINNGWIGSQGDTTIMITSNLVPSYPQIGMINRTLTSCFEHLKGLSKDAPVIVTIDGLRTSHNETDTRRFEGFIRNLATAYGPRVGIRVAPSNRGLSWNVYDALKHVRTEFLYLIQHDMPFIKDVDHTNLIKSAREYPDDLRIVRFGLYPNTPQRSNRGNCFARPTPIDFVNGLNFTKTSGWSDNNQFASKAYYDEIFQSPIDTGHKGQPMEATMMYAANQNCSRWGPHLYGARGKLTGRYIAHLDGRNSLAY